MIINEMAMHRQDYIDVLKGYKNTFMTHVYLVASSSNREDINHWITELVTYCKDLDQIRLKTKRGLPETKDILEYLLIECKNQVEVNATIKSTIHNGKNLDISEDKLKKFILSWKTLRLILANSLSKGQANSRLYYSDLFNRYLVNN